MKARGIFAITAMLAALAANMKRFYAVQSHSTGEGRIRKFQAELRQKKAHA